MDDTGAGVDETGAGVDETGAGVDETGAGVDETGAGVDETRGRRGPKRVGIDGLARLLHPKSIALVGASSDRASIGGAPLALLERFGYRGQLYLVSRTRAEVDGMPCAASIDELPEGVDVAVLAIPKAGVAGALEAAGRRGIGGVVVFSSGYAELGPEGSAEQLALARLARSSGLALAGPNCLGLVNFVDGVPLTFGDVAPNRRRSTAGAAFIAQSGAMSLALTYAAQAQDIPVTYTVSTGNEALLGTEDYLGALLEEEGTKVVALLVEQIRRPAELLALAGRARERGVALCVLHAGRGERSREASRSHTGAMAGEQAALRAALSAEGVLFIDSLDELVDAVGLCCKCPLPAAKGVGFMTDSGALKTLAIDFAEDIGLELPELSEATRERLAGELPAFAAATNPTDITAMGLNDPSLYARCLLALLEDQAIGSAVVAAMPGSELQGTEQVNALVPAISAASKPVVYVVMGGEHPIPEANRLKIQDAGIPLFRSAERALKALHNLVELASATSVAARRAPRSEAGPLPLEAHGRIVAPVGEAETKALLRSAGLRVPASALAKSPLQAREAAGGLGYPVVLKVASPDIAHKTDVGGVAVVRSEAELDEGFERILAHAQKQCPQARLDGVLVEEAILGGTEVIVGARRDPEWGVYVVAGLGGIWAEALGDTVIVPGSAGRDEVAAALCKLRAFPVLSGARGRPAADLGALVDAIALIGSIVRSTPGIGDLEVNPLVVLGEGEGAVAVDALLTPSVRPR